MRHLEDSELLSYIENTAQRGSDIAQHLADCSACQERVRTLAETTRLLRAYMHSQYEVYPSIVNAVIQEAQQSESVLTRHRSRQSSFRIVSLPVALVLALICLLVALTVLAYPGGIAQFYTVPGNHVQPQQQQPTIIVPAQPRAPFISVCATESTGTSGYIHICGHGFTPDSQVELLVNTPGMGTFARPVVVAHQDGSIEDVLYITSCKDIPATIVATNRTHQSERSQVLRNIHFGSCPSVSGVVGTSEHA